MRLLLFSLGIFCYCSVNGQSPAYVPFPDSSATWCSNWGAFTPPDCYINLTTHQIDGQTVINNVTYNRLSRYSRTIHYYMFNGFFCDESDTTVDTTAMYIRQDISLKTVWEYNTTTQSERVLYNFNLNIGDTLDETKVNWHYSPWGPYVITSIDSVLINGAYRNRYNYGSGCSYVPTDTSMIEGIGSLHGLMNFPSCFEYDSRLNAFTQDNILLYGDTSWGVCHDFTSGLQEIISGKKITLFPNPFRESATLKLSDDFLNTDLTIYNALGEQVQMQKITSAITNVSRNGLRNGMYFFRLTDSRGKIVTGKFVVE